MSDQVQVGTPEENLSTIVEQMRITAQAYDRNPEDVSLVAVAKRHGPDRILPVLKAGQRVFGENRVQEAKDKWPPLREKFSNIELHLIGPLQTNKIEDAIEIFDVIETVDRPKLARRLAEAGQKLGKLPRLYIQVNTGEEPQKAGVLPREADDFIASCRKEYDLPVEGIMCIPPVDEESALHFALLKKIADRNGLKFISMGMSSDFETAISLGATHVRVGTAIFGERA